VRPWLHRRVRPWPVGRFGQSLPNGLVVVDPGIAHIGEWKGTEKSHGLVGIDLAGDNAVD